MGTVRIARAALASTLVVAFGCLLTLALPVADATAATCAAGPVLVNGGLEVPATGVGNTDLPAANAGSPTPGIGWSTDDPGTVLEIWQAGFGGVPADSGDQFVEINANAQDTLTQDVATVPGSKIRWHLAHRGRGGTDVMQIRLGPPGGPLVAQVPDGQAGTDLSDGNTAWGHYTAVYTVPAGQTTTRLAMVSISEATAPSFGNFLDSVSLELLPTASDDAATTTAGHSVTIPVLANDCGSGLAVHTIAAVAHGTAVVSGTSIKYTAPATFVGTVTFAYTLFDSSGDPATAVVTVHVGLPAGPTVVPERSIGRPGVVQVVHPTVPTGAVLRLVDAQGHVTTEIAIAGQGVYAVVGRTLTFTPAAGFIGDADAVRYRVTDGFGQSATSTYRATVFVPPPTLPDTGADYLGALLTALGLIGAGLLLVLVGRRSATHP